MRSLFQNIINTGVKENNLHWEIYLIRKLNLITLIGVFNIFVAFIYFYLNEFYFLLPECAFIIVFGPGVIFSNKFVNYKLAAYWFYIMGYIFFIFMNLKMGKHSYTLLFYFPMIISSIQLLGRREMLKHLIIINVFFLITVIIVALGLNNDWLYQELTVNQTDLLRTFNIIMAFVTAVLFISVVVIESSAKERRIENMLREKEVLLAEVFHRVKNNMNIVTSLLNLKKNMSDSPEVQNALEDCRSRVYSMALVHHKIYNSKNIVGLKFKDYIAELINDLARSLGNENNSEINIEADDVYLELSNAIPCGLILNELVTNSFKYAVLPGKKLSIGIKLKKISDKIVFEFSDNGPGLSQDALNKSNSLGIELIKSLSEQIDGKYNFSNENGLKFTLEFKAKEFK